MANVNFEFNAPSGNAKVYIEQVFAEKPAGGMVAAVDEDYPPTTAVYFDEDDNLYHVIDNDVDEVTEGQEPVYITGNWIYGGKGDQAVRLINGANIRKENANIAAVVAAELPLITLV